jgi:predicted HicB family RNase H-like nuclease
MKTHGEFLHMRVPAGAKAKWKRAAKRARVTLAEWVRQLLDGAVAS